MSKDKNTGRWTVIIWVAVAALTVKTFLPDVLTRAGEEMQPVIDGANRVVAPAFERNQGDTEGESFMVSNPDQSNHPEDEESRFWEKTGGKP